MRNCYLTGSLYIIFCLLQPAFGQDALDTSFRQKSIENTLRLYDTSMGLQSHLYNGPLYIPYSRAVVSGHPFFYADSVIRGSVAYDGLEYYDIPMRYDLVRDELIIQHPTGFPLNLIKQKLDSFKLFDQHFIKLENVRTSSGTDSVGYYHQLYHSPSISFLAKREKDLQEVTGASSIETSIYTKDYYYILKNKTYHSIKNKKTLLEVLKDKKYETQQYIKRNKLKFRQFEEDALQTISFYDQLK